MKSALACLLAITALTLSASEPSACSCAFNTPLEQLAISDVVVTASVVSVTETDRGDGSVVNRALVSVESIWKGNQSGAFVVETTTIGSCTFTLQEGKKYLIYANLLPEGELFMTHECMRTQEAEFASTDFEELGPPVGVGTPAVPATWGIVKSRYR